MFAPDLLARFAKTKTPGKELAHADFLPQPDSNHFIVRQGTRFRGAIMGIDRESAAQNEHMEPEGLW